MRTTLALDDELVAKAQAFHRLEREVKPCPRSAQRADRTGKRAEAGSSRRQRTGDRSCDQATADARLILVDTSIWIDHLRGGSDLLAELLSAG